MTDIRCLVGRVEGGSQRLRVLRILGIEIDAPAGGEHLLNNNNEFDSNPHATRLIVYVYDRP
ncbi:MAG TPA: hypothetical protein DHW45_17700 [Candidatus Latescibacteria bacterium]|nr:hypothetical protein [Candidatus Latescibacterota bacterium]